MKIAISADGKNIGENNVTTFCICDCFLIIDTKANSLIAIDNKNKGRPSKVGRTAGQLVSKQGVDAVIASEIGPQALDVFDRHKIKVYQGDGKIHDAIRQLEIEGRLPEITKTALQRYMNLKQEK
jgi:predicted Fe-Mo cluster-binding NifX family protein